MEFEVVRKKELDVNINKDLLNEFIKKSKIQINHSQW
jgi:hypothetical protein